MIDILLIGGKARVRVAARLAEAAPLNRLACKAPLGHPAAQPDDAVFALHPKRFL